MFLPFMNCPPYPVPQNQQTCENGTCNSVSALKSFQMHLKNEISLFSQKMQATPVPFADGCKQRVVAEPATRTASETVQQGKVVDIMDCVRQQESMPIIEITEEHEPQAAPRVADEQKQAAAARQQRRGDNQPSKPVQPAKEQSKAPDIDIVIEEEKPASLDTKKKQGKPQDSKKKGPGMVNIEIVQEDNK